MKIKSLFFTIIIVIILIGGLSFFVFKNWTGADEFQAETNGEQEDNIVIKSLPVVDGSTYGKLMADAGVSATTTQAIFTAAEDVYDLSSVRVGRTIDLVYKKDSGDFIQLIYRIDSEEELFVTYQAETNSTTTARWLAERAPIDYEIMIKTVSGTIESSMYESATQQGIDERAIIAYADVFQWSVDFAWQVQSGDSYKFIYEERYRDGEYVMPGKVLAGKFTNVGADLYAFYYYESDDNDGYYDHEANSVQKVFLKAPLAFKYISSGFTTGARYIQAFNISTGHRAIDYAAEYGTPIRAVGGGTVIYAGWNGAYGNFVSVRHSSTYTTNYGHMSKIAVSYGQRVTQGQTIGYVGSTGLSTGPHLHYEMVKNGVKINPLLEVFPPNEAIKDENKEDYFNKISSWREELDN
ncbi:MAG TPA: peptidoglycan DD-metalloendopeptidase family protein, partial [Patescibacteria group bacterium]|nr:peptidoglycan DD-metalloendopeptidase family protein [Patescibacteria group bacterium]